MRVAIIQSSYIPWKGYFDIIHDVDQFIFLDDVQFTTRDWRTRNRIKTAQGVHWLSIPAGCDRNRKIHEVTVADREWQRKHWQTIAHAYARAPYFSAYRNFFEQSYLDGATMSLSEFNQALTQRISRELLGITTVFHDSRSFAAPGHKLDKILELLKQIGATSYVTGPSAADYLEPERFRELGIKLILKDYSGYPQYPQLYPPFEHAVSILDMFFNVGQQTPDYIWGWRQAAQLQATR